MLIPAIGYDMIRKSCAPHYMTSSRRSTHSFERRMKAIRLVTHRSNPGQLSVSFNLVYNENLDIYNYIKCRKCSTNAF